MEATTLSKEILDKIVESEMLFEEADLLWVDGEPTEREREISVGMILLFLHFSLP